MSGLRNMIARWLAPEAFRIVERYHYQRATLSEAYRWLGEFDDVCATIEWARVSESNHFRALGEEAFEAVPGKPWIWSISDFREHLRAEKAGRSAPSQGEQGDSRSHPSGVGPSDLAAGLDAAEVGRGKG